ncbi:MAG: protein kinase, partial [Myxococcota bacterium]
MSDIPKKSAESESQSGPRLMDPDRISSLPTQDGGALRPVRPRLAPPVPSRSTQPEHTAATVMDPGGPRAHSENPQPQLGPGELVEGRYRVEALLGSGGFGEVYRVHDEVRGEPVALKLHRIGRLRRRARAALEAEFALLAGLAHPNLARVYNFGTGDRGYAFFTQELIEGEAFQRSANIKALAAGTDFSARDLLAQVLRALDYLHARGIVHGDIKPSNLLVEKASGRVVVLDFGVTRTLGQSADDLSGSPSYMAPELIRGWSIDGRSDLYALGVMLYRMLSGRFPFDGDSTQAIFAAHLGGDLKPLRFGNKPAPLGTWVQDLLATNPAERPATAREALLRLGDATGAELPVDTQATLASHISFAPFIERGTLMSEMMSVAELDGVNAILLEGEAGTGKSRLLDEIRQRLQLQGGKWTQIRGRREGVDSLETEFARAFLTASELQHLTDEERRTLAPIVPSLRRKRLAEPLDPERAAFLRRRLLGELVARASLRRDAPFIIGVEDLQWTSAQGQAFLTEVLAEAHEAGAFATAIATTRPGGADPSWARVRPNFLSCDRFSPNESEAFAEALLGGLSPLFGTPFLKRLRAEPAPALWVQESLRLACDEGVLRRDLRGFVRSGTIEALELPDVLGRRVGRLDAEALAVAGAIATVGERVDLADLSQVAGLTLPDAAAGVETLLRHGIVVRVQEGREVRLRMHDRFVDATRAALEDRARRSIRRRAAQWVQRRAKEPEALLLAAELFAGAGRDQERSQLLERALAAADAQGRPDVGLRVIDRGRALGQRFDSDVLLREFDMAMRVGQRDRAEGALWQAERRRAPEAETAFRRARLELRAGELDMARQRLLPHLDGAEGVLRAEILLTLADIDDAAFDAVRARARYDEASRVAARVGDARREARALLGRCRCEVASGDLGSIESARSAAEAAKRAGDASLGADAKRHLGYGLRLKSLSEAARAFRAALRAARTAGSTAGEAEALHELGEVAVARERPDDAITALRRAVRLKRSAGLRHSAQRSLVALAHLLRATGDFVVAEELMTRFDLELRRDPVAARGALLEGDFCAVVDDWVQAEA